MRREKCQNRMRLILKSIGLAMGVSSLTLLILKNGTSNETILTLLSIGLTCFGIVSLNEPKKE